MSSAPRRTPQRASGTVRPRPLRELASADAVTGFFVEGRERAGRGALAD